MEKSRRFDVDWVRVIAFDILIVYHVGMFFVPWGWHIKNNEIVEWIRWPMLFVSQWRIPILFVVSGIGTRFAISNKSGIEYIAERFKRLFFPLLVGILLIVSPQVYIERIAKGQFTGSFFEFYPNFFEGIYPEGNFSWHHLWFLPYLLLMSIMATPLFLSLRKEGNVILTWLQGKFEKSSLYLYLFAFPLLMAEYVLQPFFPVTDALIGDWYALAIYFMLFLSGYILVSLGKSFWIALDKTKHFALITGVISFLILLGFRINSETSFIIPFFKIFNMWSWILVIFAFASRYLNNESRIVKYRNRAVYPFYILHQTITVICGYYLMDMAIHYSIKMLIMILITFGGSWLLYELIIVKIPILQPLFGVKKRKKKEQQQSNTNLMFN